MGKNEEGGYMTKLLSDHYRHVLSNGMDWVYLFDEVKYTENYLQIQSIRYRDILDFEICTADNVENIKIPKLTLQPLVENAIYHGIKPLNRKGELKLLLTQDKDHLQKDTFLYIRIMDDGVGFSKEKFAEVLSEKARRDDNFGLRNVVDRLHLCYGSRCQVELEDSVSGTTILIRIQVPEETQE